MAAKKESQKAPPAAALPTASGVSPALSVESYIATLDESGERLRYAEEPPTLRDGLVTVQQIRVGTRVEEILYRFSVGDFAGALGAAQALLDAHDVPVRIMGDLLVRSLHLDLREEYVLSLVDEVSTIDEIVQSSGLPMLDALRTLAALIEKSVIALREDHSLGSGAG